MPKFVIAALVLVAIASGCDGGDTWFQIIIKNDTSSPVQVIQCGKANCSTVLVKTGQNALVQPGESTELQAVDDGVYNTYVIEATDGTRLGCVPLMYIRVPPQREIDVSSAPSCDLIAKVKD